MKCRYCGAPQDDGGNTCRNCGAAASTFIEDLAEDFEGGGTWAPEPVGEAGDVASGGGAGSAKRRGLVGLVGALVSLAVVFGPFAGYLLLLHHSTFSSSQSCRQISCSTNLVQALSTAEQVYSADSSQFGRQAGAVVQELADAGSSVDYAGRTSPEATPNLVYIAPFSCLPPSAPAGSTPSATGFAATGADTQCQGLLLQALQASGGPCWSVVLMKAAPGSTTAILGADVPGAGVFDATTQPADTSLGCAAVSSVGAWNPSNESLTT